MGIARIQAASDEVRKLSDLCTDYTSADPSGRPPPVALLRQLACAGRELVLSIGEHVAQTDVTGCQDQPHALQQQGRPAC